MYQAQLKLALVSLIFLGLTNSTLLANDNKKVEPELKGKSYLNRVENNTGQSYSDSMNILFYTQKQIQEQREKEKKDQAEKELARKKVREAQKQKRLQDLLQAQALQQQRLQEQLKQAELRNKELQKDVFDKNQGESTSSLPLVLQNFYTSNQNILSSYKEAIGGEEDKISLRVDRSKYITPDQYIQVLLTTSLSTRRGSSVVVMVERDVTSKAKDNGTSKYNILLPKGTTFICSYEPLSKQGETSVDLSCQEGFLPDGRALKFIDAPNATDQMGRAGAIGKVDNRLWEKYGNAFIVAGLTGMTMYASSSVPRNAISDVAKYTSLGMMQTTQNLIQNAVDLSPIISITAGTRLFIRPINPITYGDFTDYQSQLTEEKYKANLFSNTVSYGKHKWWHIFFYKSDGEAKSKIHYGKKHWWNLI